ncbi:anti-virulence regulator CigR family protein [Pseudomonas sp. SMV71]|uniref:anti-virulence regulator CigR family protein n=1 Tax=Pseudomonas sp. SMV71 TaxID=3390195 RepID=UPI003F84A803
MLTSRSLIAAFTCLALVAGSEVAMADPGNGKGNAQFDHGQGHGQGGQGGPGNKGGQGNPGNKGNQGGKGGGDWHNGPSIDRGGIINVIGGYRDYWSPGPALPPGIQKNLARGKPLPPGIAKKLDGRLLGRLPHYDGYEWRQAGTDLILVAIASGIIYEVLSGAFD